MAPTAITKPSTKINFSHGTPKPVVVSAAWMHVRKKANHATASASRVNCAILPWTRKKRPRRRSLEW
jgi:hypothetical protein